MPYSKADMVVAMAKIGGVSKEASEKMLDSLVSGIAQALEAGERVAVTGLGGFIRAQRKERKGRDLRTGAELTIPACEVVRFSAARSLRKRLNPVAATPPAIATADVDPVQPTPDRILPRLGAVRSRPPRQSSAA